LWKEGRVGKNGVVDNKNVQEVFEQCVSIITLYLFIYACENFDDELIFFILISISGGSITIVV
jgi:hypothetical protein